MPQAPTRSSKPSGSSAASSRAESGGYTIAPWWRRGISALLILHLIVVIAVPLTIMQPSSRLAATLMGWVRPYVDITQASHGYGFFASEPGPSHLIQYELAFPEQQDGKQRKPEMSQFPDIKKQWPRLRYHRHFMLAEKAMSTFGGPYPPREPAQPPPDEMQSVWVAENWRVAHEQWKQAVKDWERSQALYKELANSFADHLLAESGAESVRLQLVQHQLSSSEAVVAGANIDDDKSYRFVPNTEVFRRASDAAAPPPGAPEEVPAPVAKERPIRIPGRQP